MITGDLHDNCVADLKADFGDAFSATLGTDRHLEGDGAERSAGGEIALAENPHVHFHN